MDKVGTQAVPTGIQYLYSPSLGSHSMPVRSVTYGAGFNANGNAFLAIYGWTTKPLVEYYIVDTWVASNPIPSNATSLGSITVDGAVYDLAVYTRVGLPNLSAASPPVTTPTTIQTLYSVRRNKRTTGTIDISKHITGWAAAGYSLGSIFDFQILSCHAYFSAGNCSYLIEDASVNPPA